MSSEQSELMNYFNDMQPLHAAPQNQVTTPITQILGTKNPAMAFTLELFKTKPNLFGAYGASVIYAQYSGTAYKPQSIYDIFESFITFQSPTVIEARRTRPLSIYETDPDLLITWARLMQQTQTNTIFEPVMNNLGKVLNNWLDNRRVVWGGIEYDINIFKPLCYNASGECFITLLPYICYIMTFLIHCRPFTFNEAQTNSSTFGFFNSLEQYYQLNYQALGEDFDIDVIRTSLTELLQKIPENYFVDLFKVMLNPDKIIEIRNNEIRKTENLLNECLTDQNSLTYQFVQDAFNMTMSQMLKRIISLNPIHNIFNTMPRFQSNGNVNVCELSDWTEYCLANGDKPFCIEPETSSKIKGTSANYPMVLNGDPKSIKPLPTTLFGKQQLKSKVPSCAIAEGLPFCSADIVLQMAKSYVYKEFLNKRNDPLDNHQITIDESLLRNNNLVKLNGKPFHEIIKDLFVPALWMYDNSSMATVLNILLENEAFVSEVKDILSLSTVTQIVYDNMLASVIIVAYVLSFMNTWILHTCNHAYPLKYFSPYTYICELKADGNRIAKLADIAISMCYISTDSYAMFVQNCMHQFQNIMINSPIIQQPYIKCLDDMADIYAIGGCELYNYAKYANPLVRGYGWVSCVNGNSENLETFYRWVYGLQNNALMELLESSVGNSEMIDMNLQVQWTKLYANGQYPNLLLNYSFTGSGSLGYKLKGYPYVLDLKTSNGTSITKLIDSRTFGKSNVRSGIPPQIVFKPIEYKNGIATAGVAQINGMLVDGAVMPASVIQTGLILKCPVYDYNGDMNENKVMYMTPGGTKLIMLQLINTRHVENQTIMVFSNVPRNTRFQNYLFESNSYAPYREENRNDSGLFSTFANAFGLGNARVQPRNKKNAILSDQSIATYGGDKNEELYV